jgi:regulator of sirC expression with transglutaminase-like and TPR domain
LAQPFAESPEFQRLIDGGGRVLLARIALEIARDAYPTLDVDTWLDRIRALAARIRTRCRKGAKTRDVVGQINWVFFVEEELRGNTEDYYDPRNSYLNEVLERRLGIPLSLSILYWAVAEFLKTPLFGVNLPYHFLLRFDEDGEPWFVDAFHAGAVYSRGACRQRIAQLGDVTDAAFDASIEPCTTEVVVTRMLRNLKAIYGRSGDMVSLLPVQRRLVALNPHDRGELRDLGMVCTQTEHIAQAIDPFRAYLKTSPPPDVAAEIQAMLDAIMRRVAQWN